MANPKLHGKSLRSLGVAFAGPPHVLEIRLCAT